MLLNMPLQDVPFGLYYLFAALVLAPVARIFKRAGVNRSGVLLLAVPEVGFMLCTMLLVLKKWPEEK